MGTARTPAKNTDVLEILTAQHAEVDDLIEQLEGGRGDQEELFTQLADKLAAHATVEETIFYPGVMAEKTEEQLQEAVEEHLVIKRLLADMIELEAGSDEFNAKLSVLKENVSHHAHEEEEGKLFPILRRELDADVLAALGNEVIARFEELLPTHPYRNLPSEIDEAATLPPPS